MTALQNTTLRLKRSRVSIEFCASSKFYAIVSLSLSFCRWLMEWDFNMAAVVISARVSIAEMFWTRWVIATTGWRTTHRLVGRNDILFLYQLSSSNRSVCVRKPGFRENRFSRKVGPLKYIVWPQYRSNAGIGYLGFFIPWIKFKRISP